MRQDFWNTGLDRYSPPGGGTLTQRTSPKEAADKMLAEKRAKDAKVKLTWSRDNAPLVPMDNLVGEVNLNLPYVWINKTYYIQNGTIYLSNGLTETTLEEIVERDPANYKWVKQAFESYKNAALKRDPSLCGRCADRDRFYRFEGTDDATTHNAQEHPEMIEAALAKVMPTSSVGHVTAPVGQECCGKPFATKAALNAHRRFSKSCPNRG